MIVSPLTLQILSYLLWLDLNPSSFSPSKKWRGKVYLGDIRTVTWLTPADPLPLPLPLLLTEKMSRLSEGDLMISLVTSHSVTAAVTGPVHLQHQTVLLLLTPRNLSHLKIFCRENMERIHSKQNPSSLSFFSLDFGSSSPAVNG